LDVARHEPAVALDGGPNGLGLIDCLLAQAVRRMAPGGLLLLEIESSLSEPVRETAVRYFPLARFELLNDLSGKPRLLEINT
jgi:release factor glutamine methyltransferase